MESPNLFTIDKLCAWYTQGKPVLSDFSIELRKNEVIGLIGLNGAGKTTFIKTLSGLMNGFRVATVAWNGAPISFRDKAFKLNRYVASSYGKPMPDVAELVQGFHFAEYPMCF